MRRRKNCRGFVRSALGSVSGQSGGGESNQRLTDILSDDQLRQIEKRMIMEINWGLGRETNPSSNIKSYITYVSQLPTGREAGQYLALDLGGTNFRLF